MEIIGYEPTMSSRLASAYNSVICGVPHCYPVSADEFASAVAGVVEAEGGDERLHSETAFVAVEGAAILGFVHVAIERPRKPEEDEEGIIRFFWYERGRRAAGQALLEAAEEYLRERSISSVQTLPQEHRYSFYHLAHAYLSDHLDQVHALLGINGYERARGEVYLDWPDYAPVAPTPTAVEAEISVEWRDERGTRPDLILHARQGETEIGVCHSVSAGNFSRADEAQDWFLTVWLGIEGAWQGKGLGCHLLQLVLQEMRGVGYRHAAISTSWRNYRAFLSYSNYGYRVSDWTYGLRRELG